LKRIDHLNEVLFDFPKVTFEFCQTYRNCPELRRFGPLTLYSVLFFVFIVIVIIVVVIIITFPC
jgi:hypothetical protein